MQMSVHTNCTAAYHQSPWKVTWLADSDQDEIALSQLPHNLLSTTAENCTRNMS